MENRDAKKLLVQEILDQQISEILPTLRELLSESVGLAVDVTVIASVVTVPITDEVSDSSRHQLRIRAALGSTLDDIEELGVLMSSLRDHVLSANTKFTKHEVPQ